MTILYFIFFYMFFSKRLDSIVEFFLGVRFFLFFLKYSYNIALV